MSLRPHRLAPAWLPLIATSCAGIGADQAAPATALRPDPGFAAHFPAAARIADGIDDSGERALREGDRLAIGVEVAMGDEVERHLLELIVHLKPLAADAGIVTFHSHVDRGDGTKPLDIPQRHTRRIDLELVLHTPDGEEQRRTRIDDVPEFVLDESFLPAIRSSADAEPRTFAVAVVRLIHIANMLQGDDILQDLLHQAASVPLDITLLWRRDLALTPHFDQGRPASGQGEGLFELPFDINLNEALLVRLVATVGEPRGAAGAIGGIVGLRAQDARHPERNLTLRLLGAARGPASEWQRRGVLATYAYTDEGIGMAFSPDGRWLAMPSHDRGVEIHELDGDPTVARRAPCAGTTRDLAFLDEETLLVATSHHVQVFGVRHGEAPRLLATHELPEQTVCALEVVDDRHVFVGGHGFALQRWQFAADRRSAPQRELLQAPRKEQSELKVRNPDGTVTPLQGAFTRTPEHGWLCALAADRVLARDTHHEHEWQRAADGSWSQRDLPRNDKPTSCARRLDANATPMFDRIAKGLPLVRHDGSGVHAWGAGPVSLTGPTHTRMVNQLTAWPRFTHGFSADGRHYAYVAPGYRLLIDVERCLAASIDSGQ